MVFFSPFFKIGRGCRQGDPISPYLFLLCVEIMAILTRKNQNIKGLYINDKEHKLFQYTDDTGIFLDGSENSLKNALDLLDQFSKYSGLTPNFEKKLNVYGLVQQEGDNYIYVKKGIWNGQMNHLLF